MKGDPFLLLVRSRPSGGETQAYLGAGPGEEGALKVQPATQFSYLQTFGNPVIESRVCLSPDLESCQMFPALGL